MRLPNLSPTSELLYLTAIAAAWAILMVRAGIVAFKELTGVREFYPTSWTDSQCRMLGFFRSVIGVALLLLWGLFMEVQPSLPNSWPFGRHEASFIAILLLLSSAWTLLLVPGKFRKFGPVASRFWVVAGFLVLWWSCAVCLTIWLVVQTVPSSAVSGAIA
jgi:hypothetical protein